MDEAHNSAYCIHPVSTKMYMDLKQKYWWNGMKADIARFVAHCDTCQRIKETRRTVAALTNPGMEMGRNRHGLCSRFAKDSERT
jgi:hypothetical protein